MKTSTILASLLIVITQASFANQSDTEEKLNKQPDMTVLATQLTLDDSQAQRLEDIMQHHKKELNQLRQEKRQARKDMHLLRDQHREQLLTILDHRQLYELENYMHQFKRRGKPQKD